MCGQAQQPGGSAWDLLCRLGRDLLRCSTRALSCFELLKVLDYSTLVTSIRSVYISLFAHGESGA